MTIPEADQVARKEAWRLIITFIGAFVSAAVAVGSGVGGGSLFLALYILILSVDLHYAIPLSKATILGVGIAAFYVNYFKRHPTTKARPLIDYDLTVMFEPITLCGTLLGVILNVLFPSYLVLVPLILLLSFTFYKTLQKGKSIAAKERAAREKKIADGQRGLLLVPLVNNHGEPGAAASGPRNDAHSSSSYESSTGTSANGQEQQFESEEGDGEEKRAEPVVMRRESSLSLLTPRGSVEEQRKLSTSSSETHDEVGEGEGDQLPMLHDRILADTISKDESARFRPVPMLFLTAMWCMFLLSVCLLYAVPSISRCSGVWVFIFLATIAFMVALTWVYGRRMVALTETKVRIGFEFAPGEIRWDQQKIVVYPACCFIVGLAAAGLGVGGGLLSGPLMLRLGVEPAVSAATSSFMIMFTASASTLQYALLGRLTDMYGLYFGLIGFAGGLLGQKVVSHLVQKHQKQSILVFLLAFITVFSALAIVIVESVGGTLSNTSFSPSQVCAS